MLGGRVNHSAAPIRPPTATAVNGTAIPRMPASTISEDTGRLRAIIPVVNCGASRVMVAAAVNANAPRAPIMKPSNDSRVDGRVGSHHHRWDEHQDHAPDRDPETLSKDSIGSDPGAEWNAVGAGDHRTREQHPAHAEDDSQGRGEKQGARGDVVLRVGLPHVEQEQQRKP